MRMAACALPLTRADGWPRFGLSALLQIIPNLSVGEPLNVIVSGQSDAGVLTPEGFGEYMQSLYFSP